MLRSDGTTVPEGVYFQWTTHRGQPRAWIWVPPDPAKTVGNSGVVPAAVSLDIQADSGGSHLELRRTLAPSTRWTLVALILLTVGELAALAWLDGGPALQLALGLTLMVVWTIFGHGQGIAAERRLRAWTACVELVSELEPQALPASDDPYRNPE